MSHTRAVQKTIEFPKGSDVCLLLTGCLLLSFEPQVPIDGRNDASDRKGCDAKVSEGGGGTQMTLEGTYLHTRR
jgi:hypothetical protein